MPRRKGGNSAPASANSNASPSSPIQPRTARKKAGEYSTNPHSKRKREKAKELSEEQLQQERDQTATRAFLCRYRKQYLKNNASRLATLKEGTEEYNAVFERICKEARIAGLDQLITKGDHYEQKRARRDPTYKPLTREEIIANAELKDSTGHKRSSTNSTFWDKFASEVLALRVLNADHARRATWRHIQSVWGSALTSAARMFRAMHHLTPKDYDLFLMRLPKKRWLSIILTIASMTGQKSRKTSWKSLSAVKNPLQVKYWQVFSNRYKHLRPYVLSVVYLARLARADATVSPPLPALPSWGPKPIPVLPFNIFFNRNERTMITLITLCQAQQFVEDPEKQNCDAE
ncbi:uncharacterized protein EI97DRAFT_468969 [Westerdykella ornata]|uniref:Uncharacterized protein n=1 Tax=Westerdykella ornata TaxID=318751 RepID=A0A6A6JGC6_WESOR|nr:uncharacterized protein EI97DRAFT_468969 [Westerdykella ornata]KAF2274269.1 hypothetical protein EI97DRAFT_468969 [Westerdykella ornata]